MPTGNAICEKQLFYFIDQLEKVKVNEEEIAPLMPSVFRKLEWLEKEDVIKRLISLELNRMIDYYRDADEIEDVNESAAGRGKKEERSNRRSHKAESGFKRLSLNFGKADGLYPAQVIELINRCVPGKKVEIGHIDLRNDSSFFEVEKGEAQRVIDGMNSYEVDGRSITVKPAQGNETGTGRKGKHKEYKSQSSGGRSTSRRAGNSDKPWRRASSRRKAGKR